MTHNHEDRHDHRHDGGCGCGRNHHHPHDHHEDGAPQCSLTGGSGHEADTDGHHHDDGDDPGDEEPRPRPGHHDHHGHSHGVPSGTDGERRVLWVLSLTGSFMIAEVVGGLLSGSLALLADAAHMLTDSVALLLAWTAFRLARRPATASHSYGWRRFEVLAAYTNGIALFAIAAWIVVEAVNRLLTPQPVLAGEMMVVAVLGLLVNVVAFFILNGGSKQNLNLRGALLHVLGDLLGSVAAIAAAGIIALTGWTPIDPILSVLVSLLILSGAYTITREAAHILLEAAPPDFDAANVETALRDVPGVVGIHHLHTWCLTPDRRLATLHAVVREGADGDRTIDTIADTLHDRFGIDHATIQLERASCAERARSDDGYGHGH